VGHRHPHGAFLQALKEKGRSTAEVQRVAGKRVEPDEMKGKPVSQRGGP
jgi:hypothetical protein